MSGRRQVGPGVVTALVLGGGALCVWDSGRTRVVYLHGVQAALIGTALFFLAALLAVVLLAAAAVGRTRAGRVRAGVALGAGSALLLAVTLAAGFVISYPVALALGSRPRPFVAPDGTPYLFSEGMAEGQSFTVRRRIGPFTWTPVTSFVGRVPRPDGSSAPDGYLPCTPTATAHEIVVRCEGTPAPFVSPR